MRGSKIHEKRCRGGIIIRIIFIHDRVANGGAAASRSGEQVLAHLDNCSLVVPVAVDFFLCACFFLGDVFLVVIVVLVVIVAMFSVLLNSRSSQDPLTLRIRFF
jgi:hypothetical protein